MTKENKITIKKLNEKFLESEEALFEFLRTSPIEDFQDFMDEVYTDENYPMHSEFDELLDQRLQRYLEGKCTYCGGSFVWENNGFTRPDPERREIYCNKCWLWV